MNASTTTTYGPNTALVERVIEQAQAMTSEQAEELAAWDAARDHFLNPVIATAQHAARIVGRGVYRNVAGKAAWDATAVRTYYMETACDTALAARNAAWDAAAACVVRDLITPEQFDLLTAPWVSVFGSLAVEA